MDARLLPFALVDLPRYTSYPTAVQFVADFPATTADRWLAELSPQTTLSIYVHTPFCQQLCWYCACNTMAMNRPATLDAYADALVSELDAVASLAPGLVLAGVQWGGGTPGHLGPGRLRAVGERIARLAGLDAPEKVENIGEGAISVESLARIVRTKYENGAARKVEGGGE